MNQPTLDRLLTEAHIEQTVTQYLELDGWRSIKTDPVSRKEWGKGFGELGMADRLYIRYDARIVHDHETSDVKQPGAQVIWIEFKRKGLRPLPEQKAWIDAEMKRGAVVLVVDDIDGFEQWYRRSGLMRRAIR